MGMRMYTYLGPYLQCTNGYATYTTNVLACINPDCNRLHKKVEEDVRFCPICGKAPETWAKPSKRSKVSPYDVFEDALSVVFQVSDRPDKIDILVPNQRRPEEPARLKDSHREKEGFTAITPEDIAGDTAWFGKAYAEEVDKARSAYGEAHVSIGWGLVQYIS